MPISYDPDKILHSAIFKIKEIFVDQETGLTDPKAGSRGSMAKFVLTAYPQRKIFYPHVVIFAVAGDGLLEEGTDLMRFHLLLSIDVMTDNVEHLDNICDQCMKVMRAHWTSLEDWGFKRPEWPSLFRSNPMLDKRIHRKTGQLSGYSFASLT